MRTTGVLVFPPTGPGAHACWRFDDDADFRDAALAFLADGLAHGERLLYVADKPAAEMRADLARLDGERLEREGVLRVQPVRDVYEPGGEFDAVRQVQAYRELTRAAVDDGYAGLRVAADATALVVGDTARRRFVRYELMIDRMLASEPMSALCAYDGRVLGDAVGDLFAVHPLHHGAEACEPGFRAYYTAGGLCVTGEVDFSNRELFATALEAAEAAVDGDVVVDLGYVGFIDSGGAWLLDQLARRLAASGRTLRVTDAAPIVRRSADVLGFDALTASTEPR